MEPQDVDGRIAGERRGVDHEEEPPGLVVEVSRLAIEWLARDVADAVEPVLHDVALLLRDDAAELDRPDLCDRLHAEVVGGNRGGDEARRRRPEGPRAGLPTPQEPVFQALLP